MKYIDDIRALIDDGHNKEQVHKIIDFIGSDKEKMAALMSFFLDDKWHWRYNQYASWPVSHIGLKRPWMVTPYLEKLIDALEKPSHGAVARNTVRIFQVLDIPEEFEGRIFDLCFGHLINPKSAIALRCFGMTVLTNIAKKYPDLKLELIAAIQEHYPHGTAGFKSRARRSLKELEKGMDNKTKLS